MVSGPAAVNFGSLVEPLWAQAPSPSITTAGWASVSGAAPAPAPAPGPLRAPAPFSISVPAGLIPAAALDALHLRLGPVLIVFFFLFAVHAHSAQQCSVEKLLLDSGLRRVGNRPRVASCDRGAYRQARVALERFAGGLLDVRHRASLLRRCRCRASRHCGQARFGLPLCCEHSLRPGRCRHDRVQQAQGSSQLSPTSPSFTRHTAHIRQRGKTIIAAMLVQINIRGSVFPSSPRREEKKETWQRRHPHTIQTR